MPFDGGFTHKIAAELNIAADCHIDKLYQPSRDELVFLLRKKGFAEKLLISAKPGMARVQFTKQKFENPDSPPTLCMLARKHFSGARLTGVTQPGAERILELHFETADEMGDRVAPRIICELIGNQANIVLVAQNGRIIDAVRRSDPESGKRLILPGAVYEYPMAQGKLDPLKNSAAEIAERIMQFPELPLSRAVLSAADGISPLIAREIAYRATGEDSVVRNTSFGDIVDALKRILSDMADNSCPVMLVRDGVPADYSYTDIEQYGNSDNRRFGSFSDLLDAYYSERDSASRVRHAAADIEKAVSRAHQRAVRRLAARKAELKSCEDREKLRIYGELIKANIHSIAQGTAAARVQNYYDPELREITVPLDPALSPAANAAKYFKEYKKSYTAEQTLTALTAEDEREIDYLETVEESLSRCECLSDINEIRDELCEQGYMRSSAKGIRRKKQEALPREYVSPEGYRILVGRNNRQNDLLTTKIASKSDIWFHTKNIPGSHVVICCGGEFVSEATLFAAAELAAFYSKASSSEQVPVDYTPIKYVKKPGGAKPGMVIYTTNKTLFVRPKNAFETEDKTE